MRVLLVEDDDQVAGAVRSALARRGMVLDRVSTGKDALTRVGYADVVLVDLGLPDVNGLDLCRALRSQSDKAIVVVSARAHVDDRILGLRSGADDYLVKPFNIDELVERIRAVVRRRIVDSVARPSRLHIGDLEINFSDHEVLVDGKSVALSPKEYQLFTVLVATNGAVCTRERLVGEIWGEIWPGASRTLEVHIAKLRRKLYRPGLILTIRGVGYRLAGQASSQPIRSPD